jgi:hypothetical protein
LQGLRRLSDAASQKAKETIASGLGELLGSFWNPLGGEHRESPFSTAIGLIWLYLTQVKNNAARLRIGLAILNNSALTLIQRVLTFGWLERSERRADRYDGEEVFSEAQQLGAGKQLARECKTRLSKLEDFTKEEGAKTLLKHWAKYGNRASVKAYILQRLSGRKVAIDALLRLFESRWHSHSDNETTIEFDNHSYEALAAVIEPKELEARAKKFLKKHKPAPTKGRRGMPVSHPVEAFVNMITATQGNQT